MRKLLVVLFLAALSHAAETYVVAAGVEKYDDSGISTLAYAASDARTFAAALEAAGVPAGNIKLYTSDAPDFRGRPTRSNLLRALQWGREMCRPGDTLIFLFSGHGIQQGDESYLLTIESNRDLLADTALPARLIPKALDGFQGAHLLLIVDACRNNPAAGKGEENAALNERFAKAMRPKLDPAASSLPEPAVLLACAAGERAWEMPEQGSGALVYWLLRGLTGEAGETDGGVKLSDLAAYVEREVPAWAHRARREQHPTFANPGGDFALPKVPATAVRPVAAPKERGTGEVLVRSDPAGARVRIGGREVGNTPLTIDLPAGECEFTVSLDGHQSVSNKLNVLVGEIVMTEVYRLRALSTMPGTVVVASEPAGARVLVDGQDSGEVTPCALNLPPGALTLRLERQGHEPHEERITIVSGGTLRLPLWPMAAKAEWTYHDPRPAAWPGFLPWPPAANQGLRFSIATKDGMPQVLIPGGEFLMGSPPDEQDRQFDEGPQKMVYVSGFWMDLHEVTVGQYKSFCAATGRWLDSMYAKTDRNPIMNVSWRDACDYAAWAGRQLPTEAQFEKAARGGTTTTYPWGPRWEEKRANGGWRPGVVDRLMPAGAFPPNGFGVFDAIGNVREWCRDWFDRGWYHRMPVRDPCNDTPTDRRVLRGGSSDQTEACLRSACRWAMEPGDRVISVGFRCVEGAP